MLVKLLYSLRCRFFGWIKECQVAYQHHVFLIVDAKIVLLAEETFLRQRQHTHTLCIHLFYKALRLGTHYLGQWMHLSVELGERAYSKHFFYGTLGNNLPLTVEVFYHYRHATACEIERYLVYFLIRAAQ